MKNVLIIYVAALALLLSGCGSETVNSGKFTEINIEEAVFNETEPCLSEFASKIEYIPLETTESSYLGNVSKCAMDPNYIFIASSDFQKTIHVYTHDGKFLRNIGSKGRGKGEYIAARELKPITDKRALTVTAAGKSITYSAEDGSVLEEFSFEELLPSADTSIKPGQRDLFVENGPDGSYYIRETNQRDLSQRIAILDSDLNHTGQIKIKDAARKKVYSSIPDQTGKIHNLLLPWVYSSILYNFDGETNVLTYPIDTISSIDGNKLKPRYTINYGSFKKDVEIINNETLWLTNITELSNMIILHGTVPDREKISRIVFNKKNGKSNLVKLSEDLGTSAFVNDLDGGAPFWPINSDDNRMYMFLDAGKFIELSEKYNSQKMKEIAAQLTDESNPVMIAVTLK